MPKADPPRRPDPERRLRQAHRFARVLWVLELIQGRGRYGIKEIAAELESSERTIFRDLSVLELAGVPWYFDHLPVPRLAVAPARCKSSGDRRRRSGELTPDPRGRPEAVAFDQPLFVVELLELAQGIGQPGDVGEMADPKQVLLEGSDKSFGDAIALGFPDEARRAGHAEEVSPR
jgi:predicted DNA-binding transcriptional regulator YafY